ncbi:MAG TPA: hypothetical protein VK493_01525 [Bryobacteraceae bacterium]|nr:hypothetical protein [Bryobacteraceae bacterium]
MRIRVKAAGNAKVYLRMLAGFLAFLNIAALFFYLAPPGGSREELSEQIVDARHQIAAMRGQTVRLRTTAVKVEAGGGQAADFETQYFLPKRLAYVTVVGEIQRLAKASGLQERDIVYTEEPIEGTADLSLLTASANFGGPYTNLMRFLNETDHSPMLLMLDALTAVPQSKSGEINAMMRFQAIVREP